MSSGSAAPSAGQPMTHNEAAKFAHPSSPSHDFHLVHKPEKHTHMRVPREMLSGGMATATASAILNPMDVVKVRIQTQNQLAAAQDRMYKGVVQATTRIYREEGFIGLYQPGLLATVMRDMVYSSIRVGLYPFVKHLVSDGKADKDISLYEMMAAGMITGTVGSGLANPTDLVKIRLQGEAGLVRNGVYVTGLWQGRAPSYSNTFTAFPAVFRSEGLKGLYKGSVPTMVRAGLLTGGQLSSYDWTKRTMKDQGIMKDGVPLHLLASIISGLCATTFSAPADIIKTRIMNDRKSGAGQRLYTGPLDCLMKTIAHDGLRALFRGWVPSYLRMGPHSLLSLPLYEQARKLLGLEYL